MRRNDQKIQSILNCYEKESSVSTEFRRIYSNLTRCVSGKELKTLLITSPTMREGKSTSASFLAMSVATWHHKNVLVLDCDLRRPSIHQFFNLNKDTGLSEILLGENSYQDCVKLTSLDNLQVITSGARIEAPTELLASKAFRDLLLEVKTTHDLVIVDCAPVIPVNDSLILGSLLDGVVMVLKAGNTQREVAKRAVDLLKEAKANLLGVIINDMNETFPYHYNYRYYGYDYGHQKKRQ